MGRPKVAYRAGFCLGERKFGSITSGVYGCDTRIFDFLNLSKRVNGTPVDRRVAWSTMEGAYGDIESALRRIPKLTTGTLYQLPDSAPLRWINLWDSTVSRSAVRAITNKHSAPG
jgi:hypothetical protein